MPAHYRRRLTGSTPKPPRKNRSLCPRFPTPKLARIPKRRSLTAQQFFDRITYPGPK